MKKQSTILICMMLLFFCSNAQVKIGGTPVAPVPSAVLELDGGTTRGLLLPRMRKMDIDAIQNPAEGLIIYATDLQVIFLRRGDTWIKLNGTGDAFSLPFFGLLNSPDASVFHIANSGNNGTSISGQNLGNGYGVRGTTNTGIGINGISLNNAGIGGYFTNNEGGRSLVSLNKTGIGTSLPEGILHINGVNTAGNTVIIDDEDETTIQFRLVGNNKSYIKQDGNNLLFRPNGDNSSGKVVMQSYNDGGWMFLDAAGDVSLGINPSGFTGTPLGSRMNIRDNNGVNLTLDAPSDNVAGPSLHFISKTGNITGELAYLKATNSMLKMRGNGLMSFDAKSSGNHNELFNWHNEWLGANVMLLDPIGRLSVRTSLSIGSNLDPANKASAALEIAPFGSEAIRIYGDAIVNFYNGGASKGFINQQDNDLKIGTVATNDPGRFIVRTNGLDRLWVDSVGYVTIGGKIGPTLNGPYRLAVRGKIAATDFNVVASGSWPDYVFDPSYKLRSLEETEAFINEHKHLPNIPPAAVVDKEGFALGDMQKRMMEKIEELTLYLIEANKAIQRQQIEIDLLKSKLK